MDTAHLIAALRRIAAKIENEKDLLTRLDNDIADGDHGVNLARGFAAVSQKLDGLADKTPGEVLKAVGMTLVSTVGGASGPLYGTAFMRLGGAFGDKTDPGFSDFLVGFQAAIDGIRARGRADVGDKTMLDSMVPALEAMTGKEPPDALKAGADAAWKGVEYTKTIAAKKGRASYIGERSIGHQDPGATSFAMMLETFGACIQW